MSDMEIKKDPYLIGLYVVLIAASTLLLIYRVVTWEQATAFFVGVIVPSFVGRKS